MPGNLLIYSPLVETIRNVRDARPDLVVLDYCIPDALGSEVVEQLRVEEAGRNLPGAKFRRAYWKARAKQLQAQLGAK